MTVAVALNLSDGVILGVDSAVTLNAAGGVLKVYENAEKLFQLGEKPIGIATFGIGAIGTRSIGSFIREFQVTDPNNVVSQPSRIEDVVEQLRMFFNQKYHNILVPEIEAQTEKKFEEIPDHDKPILGLVVGGFSHGAYLSQLFEILIPFNHAPNSAKLVRDKGNFGSSWFALFKPIQRFMKGCDRDLFAELIDYFVQQRGSNLTAQEQTAIGNILQRYEYQIPFIAMPIDEGIAHVKFLVEMVINHYRFGLGAPIVGGHARVGVVTYKGEKFKIIT